MLPDPCPCPLIGIRSFASPAPAPQSYTYKKQTAQILDGYIELQHSTVHQVLEAYTIPCQQHPQVVQTRQLSNHLSPYPDKYSYLQAALSLPIAAKLSVLVRLYASTYKYLL